MLCVTRASLKENWREGCICLTTEFKYQQAFSRIIDYTFNLFMSVVLLILMTHKHFHPTVVYILCVHWSARQKDSSESNHLHAS